MAGTVVGLNDANAVRKYSAQISVQARNEAYWTTRFMGEKGSMLPIQFLTELEKEKGESITFDLKANFKGEGSEGDAPVSGEKLSFYSDKVYVDQKRHQADCGGKMTQQRTLHNIRDEAKMSEADWWSRYLDEQFQWYLSGARGIAGGMLTPTTFTGRANNALSAPDTDHLVYGGAATSKATVATTDKMSLSLIEKLKTKADTMQENPDSSKIQEIMIDGEKHYVLQMHSFQEYDLRTDTGTAGWLDLQKTAATALGKASPIFKGGLGMHNNVVLHSHSNVVRFNDYGAGGNVAAARALFMGAQCGVLAYGGQSDRKDGNRFGWYEELKNSGNDIAITTSSIFGIKKATYNGKDYGVIAVDTAAAKPTGI